MTRLAVGLGNPGEGYRWTPHNLGFHVVERAARERGLIFEPAAAARWKLPAVRALVAHDRERDAWLVLPQTFMNESGAAVAPLCRALGVQGAEVLVVFDDLDLELGALRIRPHGSSGGHRGVQSIVEQLGTDRFPRLRIGIGRPRTDAARHVLASMSPGDRERLSVSVAHAAEAVAAWLDGGDIERLMTRFHSRWKEAGLEGPQRNEGKPES